MVDSAVFMVSNPIVCCAVSPRAVSLRFFRAPCAMRSPQEIEVALCSRYGFAAGGRPTGFFRALFATCPPQVRDALAAGVPTAENRGSPLFAVRLRRGQ